MGTKLAGVVAGVGLLLVLAVVPVCAHHAFSAEFDANKRLQLTGTITKVEWVNPHVWIHIAVKTPVGTVESWGVEAGTPAVLFRRGFTKQLLASGTEIVVDGYQAKDASRRMNGRDLRFPDGRSLFVGSSGTGAPFEPGPQK